MIKVAIFLSGVSFATFAASGVFFLKFWKASKDSFFLYFSIACWLLSIERLTMLLLDGVFMVVDMSSEAGSWMYVIRLSAFSLILTAVVQKNRIKTN